MIHVLAAVVRNTKSVAWNNCKSSLKIQHRHAKDRLKANETAEKTQNLLFDSDLRT